MESVLNGAQKLSTAQQQYVSTTTASLRNLLSRIRNLREKCAVDGFTSVNIASIEYPEASSSINNQLKQYHTSISKYSKLVDKVTCT